MSHDCQPPSRRLSRREVLATGGAVLAAAAGSTASAVEAGRTPARQAGRRIGFVDDNLDNFHANTFLSLLRGPLQPRGFTVAGCLALNEAAGRAWAAKQGIPYIPEPSALNRAVDFFMVLAPSTPDTHLDLARRVLPFGKPTYVDKTFAPDLATAREIFRIADQYGAPLQTTSVLRHTNVQAEVRKIGEPVDHMITWGGGGSFGEYAVHPLELLISVMGPEAETVMRRGGPDRSQLLINFSRGRTGVVNVYTKGSTPYAASITTAKATRYIAVEQKPMFQDSLAAILDFFTSGQPNIDREETLAIMAILTAAETPDARERFIALPRG